jgi:hypothetical protein
MCVNTNIDYLHDTNQINVIPHEYRLTIGINKIKVKALRDL